MNDHLPLILLCLAAVSMFATLMFVPAVAAMLLWQWIDGRWPADRRAQAVKYALGLALPAAIGAALAAVEMLAVLRLIRA